MAGGVAANDEWQITNDTRRSRNPKSEIRNLNSKWRVLSEFKALCFGFRISDFSFPRLKRHHRPPRRPEAQFIHDARRGAEAAEHHEVERGAEFEVA